MYVCLFFNRSKRSHLSPLGDPHSQDFFFVWSFIATEYKVFPFIASFSFCPLIVMSQSVENIRVVQMDASKSKRAKVSVYPTVA